ncbi:MAG: pyrimidine-nucleoside phosphorylase [Candidatus Aquicultor primus]|uniref:Pyrimidine-nucleoside phosphorylase n=1 Tax=Candidatus Aquicultor primus TaxID=1797195 RepID=A0A1F2UQC5_9ACTN|nr:MAG: pyrimidine-nucleoside phosphorylase [Candidatus Aquicultor primus]
MSIMQLLAKKRDGKVLTDDEIKFLVDGYVADKIPDYQMSAFLMAAFIRGLDEDETFSLTRAMAESGEIIDLSFIDGVKVDKHSTGGVGDKVTLVLAPMMAAVGANVAKMSGRGLGHTGGTIDKLESIPGFSVDLNRSRFIQQVGEIGIALIGQTDEICPADKKIYALRDVTATVPSIPLIASSIMSKKIAGGADVIVLDVKVGTGAFMKTLDEAKELAQTLVSIGKRFGKQAVAVISDMSQPLGITIGNALEVEEAIDTMKGFGSPDLLELCTELGAQLMMKAGLAASRQDAVEALSEVLESGKALEKFREFIEAQGGDGSVVDDPRRILPHAQYVEDLIIADSGYVVGVNAEELGVAARILGAGRKTKDDVIDHTAGIVVAKKVGDYINAGEIIAQMRSADAHSLAAVTSLVYEAFTLSPNPQEAKELIYDIID